MKVQKNYEKKTFAINKPLKRGFQAFLIVSILKRWMKSQKMNFFTYLSIYIFFLCNWKYYAMQKFKRNYFDFDLKRKIQFIAWLSSF